MTIIKIIGRILILCMNISMNLSTSLKKGKKGGTAKFIIILQNKINVTREFDSMFPFCIINNRVFLFI